MIIEIAGDLGYIRPEAVAGLLAQCDETGRTLFGYMKLVESRLAALRRRTAVATGVALAVVLLLF